MIRLPPRASLFPDTTLFRSRAGFEDFVILELEPKPGGTARSGESKLVPYPWGAHYLPVPMRENADLVTLQDRKSTRLNSSHANISYAVFCLKKNKISYAILF